MITLQDAIEYGQKTVEVKKEIVTLDTRDEMIFLLYNEIERLKSKCESLQEEVIYYSERDAGPSL